jgi:hypothetical protein
MQEMPCQGGSKRRSRPEHAAMVPESYRTVRSGLLVEWFAPPDRAL